MIKLIIYTIVGVILIFVMYLAILGVNRGMEAKNFNKNNKLKINSTRSKNSTTKLKKNY